ncbi:myo-inosose-2 dehydratase [Devosia sp.]|uniref:myo-inosose-2 dehydratase n=1 Tax=Devosia sp. TaxID=1871048 RepID=UPI002F1D1AAA
MAVRIGINPITWVNDDDPSLGGATTLETILTETKAAGYAGSELGTKFPRDSAVLGPILARHGLSLVSGWYSGRIHEKEVEAEYEAILPHLTLLRDLGAKVVVYADTSGERDQMSRYPVSQRARLDDAEWPTYGRKITALADRMAEFGVRMAVHHHMQTIVETDHEIDQLMAHSGESVGLLFDTGHCVYAKGDPAALLARHVKRVNHVHCKDLRRPILEKAWATDMSFMDAVLAGIFTVPGDGSVDYPPLLARLADAGYSGWLVVEAEQDPARAHPLTYATMGYGNLRRMAEAAGFTVSD